MEVSILIADDEPNQLELMSYNLKKAGFSIIKAENGEDALIKVEDLRPDLVILDWMMPNMSGIDVCRTLRSKKETKLIPIIILSARSEEGDKSLGLDTGADDYISKPFSPIELVSRVKALLRRTKPSHVEDILEHGELRVSMSERLATRNNVPLKLGPKEFKLLVLFMERPGHIYSRSKLLDYVWGHDVFVEQRTVDVHMSRLRKALRPNNNDKDLIKTVRDGGYGLIKNSTNF